MKISSSIPTHNRLNNLINLSKSLSNVNNINYHHIRIYDDASTEYSEEEIKEIFPNVEIIVNENNMGADINTYQMCKHFLTTDDDILLICDSDLILHPESLNFIEKTIGKTDGVVSLFNSNTHQSIGEFSDTLIIKKNIGAAGTAFTKEMLKEIIDNVSEKYVYLWDYAFSAYVNQIGKRLLVSKQSYVLHAGIEGENSNIILFDRGKNYIPSSEFDYQEIYKINQIVVDKFEKMSDWEILKIIVRKIARNLFRRTFIKLFGIQNLILFLNFRKKIKNRNV